MKIKMNNRIILFSLAMAIISAGCETDPELVVCLPQRVKSTVQGGSGAESVTSDYKYENGRLDHIIMSNFQTWYYRYDDQGRISVLERKNFQTYVKYESRYSYDGELPDRVNEYRMALDRATQADKDTTFIGYRTFEISGSRISGEYIYSLNDTTSEVELKEYISYSYDQSGNMTEYTSFEQASEDTLFAYSFVYDNHQSPYKDLNLPFNGESNVNNILEKKDLLEDDVYNYQLIYTSNGYPEQINVKLGSYLIEVISIEYDCK